jgi:hypothetical protein
MTERSTAAGSSTKGLRGWPRCKLLITMSGWSLLAIASISCRSSATLSVYCRTMASTKVGSNREEGLNPLLTPTMALCFGTARACERDADPAACEGIAPRWHCYTITASPTDPLYGNATCLPSRETCVASRPRLPDAELGDCTPADAVYCSRDDPGGGLMCSATEQQCRLSLDLVRVALPTLRPSGPCTRWASAR